MMGPDAMRAWRAFLDAHARVSRILDAELRQAGLMPLSWYDALVQLTEAGGTLRMAQLADRLLMSRSATTRFADRLEEAGYVDRAPSTKDGRGTNLSVTDEGRKALKAASRIHLDGVRRHFSDLLTASEMEVLERALRRVASAGGD
jgi:DNA-binding MarR family transcriptional regulator